MTVNPNDNSNYALAKLREYIRTQDLAKDRRLPTERALMPRRFRKLSFLSGEGRGREHLWVKSRTIGPPR